MKKLWYDRAWEEYSNWQNLDNKNLKQTVAVFYAARTIP